MLSCATLNVLTSPVSSGSCPRACRKWVESRVLTELGRGEGVSSVEGVKRRTVGRIVAL